MLNKRALLLIKMIAMSLALLAILLIVSKKIDNKKTNGDDKLYLHDFAMGTSISIELYGKSNDTKQLAHDIDDKIKELDTCLISWRENESELAKINSGYNVNEKYQLSEELYYLLVQSYDICKKTDGALDITIRPLAALWNIEDATEESFKVPSDSQIKECLRQVGYEHVKLDSSNVIIDEQGMILDLGAIGKGYALDVVRDMILDSKIDGAVISVGGSVLVIGKKPDGSDWKIGIRNPKGNIDEMLGYVAIPAGNSMCISTSGDYEKYIEKDGERYHHILDVKTGYPSKGDIASVTIVCENGLVSDGLSTACFILDIEDSKQVLDFYNASAIFIDKNNEVTVVGDINFVEQ